MSVERKSGATLGAFARAWLRGLRARGLRAVRALRPHRGHRHRYAIPDALQPWFRVAEIDDVERYAGPLFRRCFRADPPAMPRHYVALTKIAGKEETLGYVHYSRLDDLYLCGGMCVDERRVRHLSSERRVALKQAGGIAEQMLRHTFAELSRARAIFGYVGDKRAERVDLRAGFRHTGFRYLVVYWPSALPEAEQRAIVERVAKLGPF